MYSSRSLTERVVQDVRGVNRCSLVAVPPALKTGIRVLVFYGLSATAAVPPAVLGVLRR